jgi:hypothetical protein
LGPYVVVLGPAAKSFVLGLDKVERDDLAASLKNDLGDTGPNAAATYQLPPPWDDGREYVATPLYTGVVAIYRSLTQDEVRERRWPGRRPRSVYLVVDVLRPEDVFLKYGILLRSSH